MGMSRIAVVGSGAIGCYYGAKLACAGSDVHFLVRGDLSGVRESGLSIRSKDGNLHAPGLNLYSSTTEIGPCDLVLVAVKATSNPDLFELIPPLLHDTTMLLTLQNGLGNEEFLAGYFGAERILGGLCFVCLDRVSRGVIEEFGHGHLTIGEFRGGPQRRTHELASEFTRSGVVCRVLENLPLERWRKLVWNIPFNGLTITAGGIDTAAILADEGLRGLTRALMDEVIGAANACGYPLPAAAALEQIRRTELMGNYKPSTLIDFEMRRPLEIEPIWGEPLRRARAAGALVPRWEELYASLREIALLQRDAPEASHA
jgi:2-dehydropantoate 2-reductase